MELTPSAGNHSEMVREAVAEYRGHSIGLPQIPTYDPHRAEAARMKAAAIIARVFVYEGNKPENITRHPNPVFSDPLARAYATASGASAVLEEIGLNERTDHEKSTLASIVFALVQDIRKMSHPDTIRALDSSLKYMEHLAIRVQEKSIYRLIRANAHAASFGGGQSTHYANP